VFKRKVWTNKNKIQSKKAIFCLKDLNIKSKHSKNIHGKDFKLKMIESNLMSVNFLFFATFRKETVSILY